MSPDTPVAPSSPTPPEAASLREAVKDIQSLAEELDRPAPPESGTTDSASPGAASPADEDPVVASVQVGYHKSGRPFLQAQGTSSLLEIRGLLWYAEREIERILQNRLQTPDAQLAALQQAVSSLTESLKDLPDALKALTKALRKGKG